jgi:apolipoprotein D and lipocalin family protein
MNVAARLALAALSIVGCTTTTERLHLPPLETVRRVEVERYLGRWYEIASFPQIFQRGCTGTTATYSLKPDGNIEVRNRCFENALDGPEKGAVGTARVANRATNAELEVSFFGPFWAPYWIIDLGPDYEYAVVGHPGRDYLWILSRSPQMADETYAAILERLRAKGYELERLQRTLQGPATAG